MATTPTPIMLQAPRLDLFQFATGNTNRDGATGSYSSAWSAGANGSLVDYIQFMGVGTVTAGVLRIFYSNDSGTTYRLLDEIAVAATTPSGTAVGWSSTWVPKGGVPMPIPSSGRLKFSTQNSETFNAFVAGGDY